MKRLTCFIGLLMLLCFTSVYAVGPSDQIAVVQYKGQPTWANAAVATTVTSSGCTPINMGRYTKICVELVSVTGTTAVSVAPFVRHTLTGPMSIMYTQARAAGGAYEAAFPAMTSTASVNKTFVIENIGAQYLVLAPTITGASTWKILYTLFN
jgi:hypothetical protein